MKYKDADRDAKAKRGRALARPELGAVQYVRVVDRLPDDGRECTVWATDASGVYGLPFSVVYRDGKWFNARLRSPLSCQIIGWNPRSPTEKEMT